MIVSVGSDHAGFQLKAKMLPVLKQWGYEVLDNGCFDDKEKVYFPDVARAVCQPVLDGKAEKAIVFCGTGVGARPPSSMTSTAPTRRWSTTMCRSCASAPRS